MSTQTGRSRPAAPDNRGQVLVVFAGALVVLLAIAAVVVDVGMVLALRRQEQNAADPAAVAAARYIRPTANATSMRQAACFYARQNGFFQTAANNDDCIPARDAGGASLTVNYPPSSSAGTYQGRPGFVEVVLTRSHKSFFANIVGIGTIPVSSSAVAAYSNGNSNSNSLVALDPGGCSGQSAGVVDGKGTVRIDPVIDPSTGLPFEGGYIQVNGTCGGNAAPDGICGTTGSSALGLNGNNSTVIAPRIFVTGSCVKSNSTTFTSPLVEGAVAIGDPMADLAPPSIAPGTAGAYCGDPTLTPKPEQTTAAGSKGCSFNNNAVLSPGVYYGGWKITGKVTITLKPGIYIIAGGGVSLGSSGEITSVQGASGDPAPVMIFSTDNPTKSCPGGGASECQSAINFTAGSDLLLRALDSGPYRGILIWQDGAASGGTAGPQQAVTLSGQGKVTLSGTVYAPRGEVTVAGGAVGEGYAAIQVIAWRWKITGGGNLLMPYDPRQLYHFDQLGLVR